MGMMTRFLEYVESTARYLRGAEPQRRKGVGERVIASGLLGAASFGWPGGWTQDRIEQCLHFKHFVYISVRAICNEIAGLTPQVGYVTDAGVAMHQRWLPHRFRKSLGAIQDHEDVQPAPPNHPLRKLFSCPNAWDVSTDLWYELLMFLELTGNAYLWCVPSEYGIRSGTLAPCELWVMPSHWVWPRLGPTGIDHYEVRPFVGPGTLRFPASEIIHLKYKSPVHKIDGWSPQTAGAEWIDAGESVDRSRFWQFKNGCFPIGNLELGENYSDPDDQDLERIYAKFFARIQGEGNYGKPIITPPGAKYVPLTISPVEMAYTQSAEQLRDWVLALFGVPKEVAGIQDAGSEIAMYGPLVQFTQRTIAPKLRYLGQVLTARLASRFDPRLRVWWDDPSPVSPDQLNKDITTDANVGAIMPNEIRALRGRRPYTPEEEEKYANTAGSAPRGTRPLTQQGQQPGGIPPAFGQRHMLNGRRA